MTELVQSWYSLCDRKFIPQEVSDDYLARLKAEGNLIAFLVGLTDFDKTQCPQCGAAGHYKIRFLGFLEHPTCGNGWYLGPGSYFAYQLSSVFRAGGTAGSALKEDSDRKGEPAGWIQAVLGFLIGSAFRLCLAVFLIPMQLVVSLAHSKSAPPRRPSPGLPK